jgi:hypothetical protein
MNGHRPLAYLDLVTLSAQDLNSYLPITHRYMGDDERYHAAIKPMLRPIELRMRRVGYRHRPDHFSPHSDAFRMFRADLRREINPDTWVESGKSTLAPVKFTNVDEVIVSPRHLLFSRSSTLP